MAPRDPRTPDCSIRGCAKAARRMGMCDAHAQLVPFEMRISCSAAVMDASMRAARKWHRTAARHVEAALRA